MLATLSEIWGEEQKKTNEKTKKLQNDDGDGFNDCVFATCIQYIIYVREYVVFVYIRCELQSHEKRVNDPGTGHIPAF